MLPSLSYELTIHVTEKLSQHPKRFGPNMELCRQPQNKVIGLEPAAKNDGVDMFEQARVVAD
jgi:hypothetical protein